MSKSIFYHAGCPVCVSAEHEIISLLGSENVEVVHIGQERSRISEAERKGVKSVPALVTPSGNVLHINFGASIEDVKIKQDIESRADIELMVNTFYHKVRNNSILKPIFDDIAKTEWDTHLPKMYAFWSSLLLGEHSYTGNPMQKHIELSKITAMTNTEFSEWLRLFHETVDELFEGIKAEEAKTRAFNIAKLMLYRIENNEKIRF